LEKDELGPHKGEGNPKYQEVNLSPLGEVAFGTIGVKDWEVGNSEGSATENFGKEKISVKAKWSEGCWGQKKRR